MKPPSIREPSVLERYLHDEPAEACPPSAWYRLRKVARRNRTLLTTAALVSLVLGTAVSVWQALLATEAMNSERETLKHLEGQTLEAQKALSRLGLRQEATRRELDRIKEAEEKATHKLFDALVAEARPNRLSRRIGQRFISRMSPISSIARGTCPRQPATGPP